MARLLLFLVALAGATPALAQPAETGVGLYMRDSSNVLRPGIYVPSGPQELFDVEVWIRPDAGGLRAWELSYGLPPDFYVVGTELHPPGSVNIGASGDLIVGVPDCLYGGQAWHVATLTMVYAPPPGTYLYEDTTAYLGPSSNPSGGGSGPAVADCFDAIVDLPMLGGGPDGSEFTVHAGGICPAPLPVAPLWLALEDAAGAPGTQVGMPLYLYVQGAVDCGYWAPPLLSISIDLDHDAAVGTLVGFDPRPLPAGWSWSIEVGGDGTRRLFLTGGAPWEGPGYVGLLGHLLFDLGDEPGSTTVSVPDWSAPSTQWGDRAAGTFQYGELEALAVTVESGSFGELKAGAGRP